MPCQQITRPAEPGEERGERKHVEWRNLAAVVNGAMAVYAGTVSNRGMSYVRVPWPMKVRMRKMQAQPASDKNHQAQKEPDDETDQIEVGPSHRRPPFLPFPEPACG